jgi:hypothetical protein
MTDAALRAVTSSNRLPRRRSIMTNDPRRLDGVDMRTSAGRRYRDIVDQLAIEFGAVNPVALRELAGLRYTLEQTQAAVVAGDARARSDLVRVNLIARRELSLREAKLALPASTPSSLQDRLTARYAPAIKGGAS